jgi:hypothetical protein
VHFCSALFIAAVISAPWHTLFGPAVVMTAMGAFGISYSVIVMRRARAQSDYQPVVQDWVWHVALPMLAYLSLVPAALLLQSHPEPMLFIIAAAALLLLFIGIYNSWDSVLYMVTERLPAKLRASSE